MKKRTSYILKGRTLGRNEDTVMDNEAKGSYRNGAEIDIEGPPLKKRGRG